MNWFQPTAGAITSLSSTCIEFVFLIYLLTLKRKTEDCYLMILIYLTGAFFLLSAFLANCTVDISALALLGVNILMALAMLSLIWASYRFYKNTFPKESITITLLFILLFGIVDFRCYQDVQLYHYYTLADFLLLYGLCAAATTFAAINHLRKLRVISKKRSIFRVILEFRSLPAKEAALFGGLAISLLMYTIIWVLFIMDGLQLINRAVYFFCIHLLTVSGVTLAAFTYFNYASERSSFDSKLVGITLFVTLTFLSFIPLILFGFVPGKQTDSYVMAFVFIIPSCALLIAVFLPVLFRLTITRHLNKVVNGVQQVITGDLTANVEVQVNDEIGRLSQNFNAMTRSLRQRSEQLHSMRETMATDFHDQTGNLLSAISRQASLLKLRLDDESELQPIVKSILDNSNQLYAGSKDFLWHLNHESDDPNELFDYLTSYGQHYYNQFDIAFSATAERCGRLRLDPSAALNLIFIFKEAMTNVVKHSGASEVMLTMRCAADSVTYTLADNGCWREADQVGDHYGLDNMQRRCTKNSFEFTLDKQASGTRVGITAPVYDFNLP